MFKQEVILHVNSQTWPSSVAKPSEGKCHWPDLVRVHCTLNEHSGRVLLARTCRELQVMPQAGQLWLGYVLHLAPCGQQHVFAM